MFVWYEFSVNSVRSVFNSVLIQTTSWCVSFPAFNVLVTTMIIRKMRPFNYIHTHTHSLSIYIYTFQLELMGIVDILISFILFCSCIMTVFVWMCSKADVNVRYVSSKHSFLFNLGMSRCIYPRSKLFLSRNIKFRKLSDAETGIFRTNQFLFQLCCNGVISDVFFGVIISYDY